MMPQLRPDGFIQKPPAQAAHTSPNILIVDDRHENLLATEKVLKQLEACIHKASSGNEALSLLLRHRFAVVLLDVQMPEMDGFETAQLMQEHESMQGVPIIFVTAISKEEQYATRAAALGAVDYIFKPINPSILRSKVKVYLDLYRQHQQIIELNEGLVESSRRLQQAQKMEAIGNLTGGMAHDFNNLLGVIIGSLDLLEEKIGDDEARQLSQSAMEAALRGAELTRRLLAFARQQPLQPSRINTNALVKNIMTLLDRILGEDIRIELDLAADAWPAIADPAQLEASLTNLATNARDAMPHGGTLTIATSNTTFDADYAMEHTDLVSGDYVSISVSDSGCGMPPEVLAHIFEPFFTTKERGKGTGLGLSMVFGFIKQSGGHINVYSEPGMGTTFRLYLPRATGPEKSLTTPSTVTAEGGSETILVVEDNVGMRNVVVRQMKDLGYRVIEADNAASALEALSGADDIDLLFTDVVMPGNINGIELAREARKRWPSMKIMLTSGFPDARLGSDGSPIEGLQLLSKPYRKQELARRLRELFSA